MMMFGLVTSDVHIMPPFIFSHNPRLNTDINVKSVKVVVVVWIKRVAIERAYIFQQEAAPCL